MGVITFRDDRVSQERMEMVKAMANKDCGITVKVAQGKGTYGNEYQKGWYTVTVTITDRVIGVSCDAIQQMRESRKVRLALRDMGFRQN